MNKEYETSSKRRAHTPSFLLPSRRYTISQVFPAHASSFFISVSSRSS